MNIKRTFPVLLTHRLRKMLLKVSSILLCLPDNIVEQKAQEWKRWTVEQLRLYIKIENGLISTLQSSQILIKGCE